MACYDNYSKELILNKYKEKKVPVRKGELNIMFSEIKDVSEIKGLENLTNLIFKPYSN